MHQLAFLALGAVGDGEDFQLLLLGIGVLSVIYLAVYVLLRRKRNKKALEEQEVSATDITTPISPQGLQ